MKRPTKDAYYLGIARAVSLRSPCLRKQYGAIIVKNDQVLATGYNGTVRGEAHCRTCTKIRYNKDEIEYLTCPAVHAEQNALLSASRNDMLGADLYLAGFEVKTGEYIECEAWPCEICLRLIKNAGINRIINKKGVIYQRCDDGILKQVMER